MAWPTDKAVNTYTDAGSDSPKLARVEINKTITNVNDIIDYFGGSGPIKIQGNEIECTRSNDDLIIDASGTGKIITTSAVIGHTSGAILLTDQTDGDFQTSSGATIGMLSPNGVQVDAAGDWKYPQLILNSFGTKGQNRNFPAIWSTRSGTNTHGANAYLDSGDLLFQFFGAGWNGDTDGTGYWSGNTIVNLYASEDHSVSARGGGLVIKTIDKGEVSGETAKLTIEDHVTVNKKLQFAKNYQETITALTFSGTISVDCSLSSYFSLTHTGACDICFRNLPTGGSATVILTNSSHTSGAVTFSTEDSTAVKFPDAFNTVSLTNLKIDVVTVLNTGVTYLGNIAIDYSS